MTKTYPDLIADRFHAGAVGKRLVLFQDQILEHLRDCSAYDKSNNTGHQDCKE